MKRLIGIIIFAAAIAAAANYVKEIGVENIHGYQTKTAQQYELLDK